MVEEKYRPWPLAGLAGMYRNPVAHDPRLTRSVTDEERLELLTTPSMVRRRLDDGRGPT